MNTNKYSNERGQSLVLVVLGFMAFIAILALVLDGGNAYAAKRQAQNAADAGALAGAMILCKEHNELAGETAAIEYAISNGAVDPPGVDANLSDASVVVTATVTRDTFFAGMIGFPQVSPVAVAEAECRPPGVRTLPVAWSCRENVVGSLDCAQQINPDPVNDPYNLDYTYIIMDSVKTVGNNDEPNDIVCSPHPDYPACSVVVENPDFPEQPYIDCDIDDDCVDELKSGGARSWLDLDGTQNGPGGGAQELIGWIQNPASVPVVHVHTWLPEQVAVSNSIFKNVQDYLLGTDVILPVFNKMCDGMPDISSDPESTSVCNYWWNNAIVENRDDISLITNSTLNYHIMSFSAFHITCVQLGDSKGKAENDSYPYVNVHGNKKDCIGHNAAATNYFNCEPGYSNDPKHCETSIKPNDKTIEGYFIELNLGGYGGPGDWIDTGTFTVVLVR
jgi:hypothetical protein